MTDTEETKPSLGARKLSAWLLLTGTTQIALSKTAGVTRQSVYRWTKGTRPTYAMMIEIRAVTGIELDAWSKP